MSRRKILMAATVSDTLAAFLFPFANHLRERGWEVDAISAGATGSSDCVKWFNRVRDAQWERNPLAPKNLRFIPSLARCISDEKYDIVHVHTPVAGFITRIASVPARRRGTRVVYTAHGFHFFEGGKAAPNLAFRTAEKIAARWTDRLVVINREDERAAIECGIIERERLRYMPGIGVDLAKYAGRDLAPEAAQLVRNELKVCKAPLFLCVAEFIPRKRHGDLLRAFSLMGNRSAHLALCGDGPLRPEMKELARELSVDDRTHFLGFRSDIPALMAAADAVVLVSEQEGLPRSVMEAMAMARPAIGTNIRGTRDLLENGGGVLVPVGNAAEIGAAMSWVIGHPAEAKAMGARAATEVKKYDIDRVLKMHDELYEELLQN